ncbi:cobalt ECF transporter T component CbiQ [Paenibacillus sp. SYP-B3998]|uniref:Cobalt ECF transporter T component CbiQ n=1 Tax=Paenibacillus sp. SYP-B3998 TaxID=2678564 RepID=A0A6G3ZQH0_9BACL|nr:cobalt ECF transporter T component CbiQ [Paenibacillus sp. SYP-B3998]NEW04456.1 cobalt ECF transporter T component CbiQ [Paenibacillus sp. SYP-B3998]
MIKLIDTLSYHNQLRAISPMWKSGFAVVMLLLSYVTHPAVQIILTVWMAIWTIGYARIPMKNYFLITGAACLFFVASLPAMIIEIRPLYENVRTSNVIISYPFLSWSAFVTSSGIVLAGKLFIRILASLSCMTFLMFSTPFSELLQVMKKVRVPSLVLEIMLIMYRFLFILSEIAHDMYVAQRSRGGQTGFRNRLKDTAILIVRMFIKTMQRYKALSDGLLSRGFTDIIQMAPYQAKPIPRRYKVESCIGVALLLLLEIWLRWGNIA